MQISYVNNDSLLTDTDERLPKDRPDLSSGECAGEETEAATVNYRPVLSSERALQHNKQ
jgi:hypothetical protein